jgi:hypothetical protein
MVDPFLPAGHISYHAGTAMDMSILVAAETRGLRHWFAAVPRRFQRIYADGGLTLVARCPGASNSPFSKCSCLSQAASVRSVLIFAAAVAHADG